jgi:hypothetical protein
MLQSMEEYPGNKEPRVKRSETMENHYNDHFSPVGARTNMSRDELLESVMMLRDDFNSMASDMRAVMQENAQLKQRLSRLQGDRESQEGSVFEIKRLKKELDTLINSHRPRGRASHSPWPPQTPPRDEEGGRATASGNDWLRKMMMVMMISEMV